MRNPRTTCAHEGKRACGAEAGPSCLRYQSASLRGLKQLITARFVAGILQGTLLYYCKFAMCIENTILDNCN
jgi:hypothetical protein